MSSTKVLKNAGYEQLPHNMMDQRLLNITKPFPQNYISPNIANLNPPCPYPIQRSLKKKEEEKVGKNLVNKENKNTSNIKQTQPPKENKKPQKKQTKKPKIEKPKIIEKEVKLISIENLKSLELNEPYDDERLALEDEYGLDHDDLFDISDFDHYETQSLHNEDTHEFDQIITNTQQISVDHQEGSENCGGLKKGIDNDALVADLSTLDGLSLYGDMFDQLQKKCFEDEYENIDIVIEDLNSPHYDAENINQYDVTISKGHEEDIEEEKIQKPFYRSSPEKYSYMIDFKDDDYEMEFQENFYNTPMIEDNILLQKKYSYRTERSISLIEEQAILFADDIHPKLYESPNRERSFSKVVEDEWYRKDWRLKHYNEQPCGMNDTLPFSHNDVDEPDYFKQFNSVLFKPTQKKEILPIFCHVKDAEIEQIKESDHLVASHIKVSSKRDINNFKPSTIKPTEINDKRDDTESSLPSPQTNEIRKYFKIMKITRVPKKKREKKEEIKTVIDDYEEQKDLTIDDVEESQERKRKKHKTTEYYYLLERKAIRMMRRYFKESFEDFSKKYKYKQNLKKLERSTIDRYFREYVYFEFSRNRIAIETIGSENILQALETIILCDRYNKNEKVTEGLDFDEIRNLLNKYNSKNLKEFFKNLSHALLFSHYYKLSSKLDVSKQRHVDQTKLNKQMESLFKKSMESLPDTIKSVLSQEDY